LPTHGPDLAIPTLAPIAPIRRRKISSRAHWLSSCRSGQSDAHATFHGSVGLRNYVKNSTDDPAEIDILEMVRASQRGHLVMTSGPFLEVGATTVAGHAAGPGDDMKTSVGRVSLLAGRLQHGLSRCAWREPAPVVCTFRSLSVFPGSVSPTGLSHGPRRECGMPALMVVSAVTGIIRCSGPDRNIRRTPERVSRGRFWNLIVGGSRT